MVFQFEHVDLDHGTAASWTPRRSTVADLKRVARPLAERDLAGDGWNSLYWPTTTSRASSRASATTADYWYESATALATLLHLHRGTPYIYQGEELGMTNVPFDDIDDFRDIESLNHYASTPRPASASTPTRSCAALRRRAATTPAPRCSGTPTPGRLHHRPPWIAVNRNYTSDQRSRPGHDPNSIFHYYQRLIDLRHTDPVIVHGDFNMLEPNHPSLYTFTRRSDDVTLTVCANLSDTPAALPERLIPVVNSQELLLSNYPSHDSELRKLHPWEARVHVKR